MSIAFRQQIGLKGRKRDYDVRITLDRNLILTIYYPGYSVRTMKYEARSISYGQSL